MALKLKIKKTLLKRKVEGVTKEGYDGAAGSRLRTLKL